jgi:RNA polymerase sigma factor (sigma-70 family)
MVKIDENNIVEFVNQGKDREVMKFLYQKTYPLVKRALLRRNAKKEDIEDVFQESVMSIYKMILEKKIQAQLNVCGLLYTISMNKWINLMRRNNRQVVVDFQEDDNYSNMLSEEVGEVVLANTDKSLLAKLFSKIGEKCLQMLTFTIYQDLMIEDIQHRMGMVSEAATKMHLKRCKDKIYEEIEKNPFILNQLLDHV